MSEWDDDMQEAAEITMRGMMSAGKELEKELEQLKASHKSEILRYARMAIDMYQANDKCTCDYEPCRCSNILDEYEIIAELEKRMDEDGIPQCCGQSMMWTSYNFELLKEHEKGKKDHWTCSICNNIKEKENE